MPFGFAQLVRYASLITSSICAGPDRRGVGRFTKLSIEHEMTSYSPGRYGTITRCAELFGGRLSKFITPLLFQTRRSEQLSGVE